MLISKAEARQLFLRSNGLIGNKFKSGKAGTLAAIEHLGYVQIDTISVVERAHHHTLFSRVPNYQPEHLHTLMEKDKKVFEYWSHAAAYLPMRDFRFSLIRKKRFLDGAQKRYENPKLCQRILTEIKDKGPLRSIDFEDKKEKQGWWEWKDSKRVLEQLFMEGKLMISGRKGFQKVYDLTERVLPEDVDTSIPTKTEMAQHLIQSVIRSNGLAQFKEINYLRRDLAPAIKEALSHLVEEKKLLSFEVEGLPGNSYYAFPQQFKTLKKEVEEPSVKILSPFDNAVIQRERIQQLFGFDYLIECYVPEAKRTFGYFVLPILYGNDFVGRIDCKAERSIGLFSIRKMHKEKGFQSNADFREAFQTAMNAFSNFNGCSTWRLEKGLKNVLKV